MISLKTGLALLVAAAAAAAAGAANANGCNGYVNQMVWGCAPWDHNNGPQYPHYVRPTPAPTTAQVAHSTAAPAATAARPGFVVPTNGAGIVAQGGGNYH